MMMGYQAVVIKTHTISKSFSSHNKAFEPTEFQKFETRTAEHKESKLWYSNTFSNISERRLDIDASLLWLKYAPYKYFFRIFILIYFINLCQYGLNWIEIPFSEEISLQRDARPATYRVGVQQLTTKMTKMHFI